MTSSEANLTKMVRDEDMVEVGDYDGSFATSTKQAAVSDKRKSADRSDSSQSSWSTQSLISMLKRRFDPKESLAELRNPGLWNDVVVETVMMMYLDCLIVWIGVTADPKIYQISITHFGIFAGLFAFVLFEGYVPLSGASMSPARSWAFFLAGRMTFARAMVYSVAETGGAVAGAMIAYKLLPEHLQENVNAIIPPPGVSASFGMAVEAILTFNLIVVGLVVTDTRTKPSVMPNISIALSIGTGTLAGGSFTGGLQNPALALGPAVASGNFANHWLYWVGPYIGATVGVLFWVVIDKIRYNFDHRYITAGKSTTTTAHGPNRDDATRL